MKKLILILVLLGLITTQCFAGSLDVGTLLDKIEWKQGIAYSIEDAKFNYLSTIEIVNYKSLTLEGGYAGAADETNHKIVGVVSYPIIKAADFIDIPILKLVELNLGVYAGYGRISMLNDTSNDNEFDWGVSATLLKVKF